MKPILFTALLGTAIALTSMAAHAEQERAVSPRTSTQANMNTHVQTYTPADTYTQRTITEERRVYGDNDLRARTQYNTSLRVAPQHINPAAGGYEDIPPSARVMGRIQGGASYND